MIHEHDLEFELKKQVELTDKTAAPTSRESFFIWHYARAYIRLLPSGVLYDDVRDTTLEAALTSPITSKDDQRISTIAAHFFLAEVGLPHRTEFIQGGVEVLHRDMLRETLEELSQKEDDELVESMEQLFGARFKGFGELAAQRHRRAANVIACTKFFLHLVLSDAPPSRLGAFMAIAHTGIGFMVEGSAVIKRLNQYVRPA